MQRLQSITILVADLKLATEFYTSILQFKKKQIMGVTPPINSTILISGKFRDTEIHLLLAKDEESRSAVGHQAGSSILLTLESSDCEKDRHFLSDKGVKIIDAEHEEQSDSNSDFIFEDLYGNKILMRQAVHYDSYSI